MINNLHLQVARLKSMNPDDNNESCLCLYDQIANLKIVHFSIVSQLKDALDKLESLRFSDYHDCINAIGLDVISFDTISLSCLNCILKCP